MNILIIGHGYVGSFLRQNLDGKKGINVWTVDSQADRLKNVSRSITIRYQDLTTDFIRRFDAILWFAGHSSVKSCISDPVGAFKNNCTDLLELIYKKADHTKFLYASTASVYSKKFVQNEPIKASKEWEAMASPETIYDASKVAFDSLISVVGENVVGLRMGTVCGWGPCLREELIFNSMNISALTTQKIWVSNSTASRSILFLDNLFFYLYSMLESSSEIPRLLNIASFNFEIGTIASLISNFHRVPLKEVEASPTYSFNMDCSLLHSLYGQIEEKTLDSHCLDFVSAYKDKIN